MVAVKKQQPGPEMVHVDLGPVRMWREDLTELIKVLGDALDKPLELESGGYTLEKVEDLTTVQEKSVPYFAAWLRADGETDAYLRDANRVHLILDHGECSLVMRDPDNGMRWAASEVVRIAKRCRRRFAFVARHAWIIFTGVGLVVTVVEGVVLNLLHLNNRFSTPEFLALPAAFWIATLVTLGVRPPHRVPRAILYTRTREEAPNFWNRKRDDIWITVVSSIVSLIAGIALGHVWH